LHRYDGKLWWARPQRPGSGLLFSSSIAVWLLLAVGGCATLRHPLPPVNLSEPGWILRQGQAIWKLPAGRPDVAGEVLLATRLEGKAYIQFSKTPFTMVVGQVTPEGWEVEFPPQNKRYAAPGTPPKRLIWLHFARVLSGKSPPKDWKWTDSDGNFRLENPANGEAIEGYFVQ
jgi:hypothetical protein